MSALEGLGRKQYNLQLNAAHRQESFRKRGPRSRTPNGNKDP